MEAVLMVQKSHSQPPFGCIKPENNGIFTISTGDSRMCKLQTKPDTVSHEHLKLE